jgi:hypothetical protein
LARPGGGRARDARCRRRHRMRAHDGPLGIVERAGLVRICSGTASLPTSCSQAGQGGSGSATPRGSSQPLRRQAARRATSSACSCGMPSRRLHANASARASSMALGAAFGASVTRASPGRSETQFRPRCLASYRQLSARSSRASRVVPCFGASAPPTEIVRSSWTSSCAIGESLTASAEALGALGRAPLRGATPGSRIANSSPPQRARQSPGSREALSRPGEVDQDGVADGVAVGVVDLLEVVGVEQQQAAAGGVVLRAPPWRSGRSGGG